MPSLGDSAFIFVLALILFGPKKLPELARQLSKLMGEFRRASNEFRMQMEEELRISEQDESRKKIAAIEAAHPVHTAEDNTIAPPAAGVVVPQGTTILSTAPPADAVSSGAPPAEETPIQVDGQPISAPPPADAVPIATSGDLRLMPPSTGLPVGRSASSSGIAGVFDAIPQQRQPELDETQTDRDSAAGAPPPGASESHPGKGGDPWLM